MTGKKILLGVCGSIAAYKTVEWARELLREEAQVQVVMTGAGARFVTPLTYTAITGSQTLLDMFDDEAAGGMTHIRLGRECDLILVAPATARTIARLAHGLAEDLLSTLILAASAKVMICPAMNSTMYLHPATQENLQRLRNFGYIVVEPQSGPLACGDEGPGRLPEWRLVREAMLAAFSAQDLAGTRMLITAGPTIEPLDPVRFLSNRSSGKMGYALALTARRRGAEVTLISGPVHLPAPVGVDLVQVNTAAEMRQEVMNHCAQATVVVKAAAVSDYRPGSISPQKLKKSGEHLTLALQPNPDILQELGELNKTRANPLLLVGFAAESQNLRQEGRRKLAAKNLDLIAVNDISSQDAGFAVDTNRVLLISRNNQEIELPLLSKEKTADRIWDQVAAMLGPK